MNTYWLTLLIIPAWFLWNMAHEGMHIAAAKAKGYKITGFYPWPHRHNGRFFFARMSYEGNPSTLVRTAPYWLDLVTFAAVYPILWIVPAAPEGWITLIVVASRPIANTLVGIEGRFRKVNPTDLANIHWAWAFVFLYLEMIYLIAVGIWIGHAIGVPT